MSANDGWQSSNAPGDTLLPPPVPAPPPKGDDMVRAPSPDEVAAQAAQEAELGDTSRSSEGVPVGAAIEHAGPVSSEVVREKAPPREKPKAGPTDREPKHRVGAFLKIPGGFSGRVTKVFRNFGEVTADEAVVAAGGPERCLRGRQGTGVPSTYTQPFYLCQSNRVDYQLVVGELDAHLISSGS